ncbi:ATP-binding protein [Lapidilactobacillus wuchangensis]|uniref:ATP-binding protein n=1 Tax=Lapidilactobacillus wuchangensis TaxID=2486001 RepID=UPI000F7A4738|nr:ATP-binding protein [Lapidilactobacillus wuchangensis]
MAPEISTRNFSVAPNVLTELLGSNLTENLSIVFAEQIKNAKDAKASEITIDLSQFPEQITISDDGEGIKPEDISETWFRAGTNFKTNNPSLLGGKGIGRFTLFALGNSIEVHTISTGIETHFKLLKSELETATSVENANIHVLTFSSNKKNGTILTIKDILPEVIHIDELRKNLTNLLLDDTNFEINILSPDSEKDSTNLMSFSEATRYATLESTFNLTWDEQSFTLKHLAYAKILDEKETMTDIIGYNETLSKIKNYIKKQQAELRKIGDITFKLFNFYEPSNLQLQYENSSVTPSKITKDFLSYDAGINIYRNNFKLFGYGLEDWLALENAARNNSKKISNTRSAGQIVLANSSSQYLTEKTNREGLQTTKKSFEEFKNLINEFIVQVNLERSQVKAKLEKIALKPKTVMSTQPDVGTSTKEIAQKTSKETNGPSFTSSIKPTESGHTLPFQIKLRRSKIAKPIPCFKSVNLLDYIDLERSHSSSGERLDSSDFTFYESEGNEVLNGQLSERDVPQSTCIVVKYPKGNWSDTFILRFEKNGKTSKSELFPLKNGKYFKLQSNETNDFFRTIMMQLNALWVSNDTSFNYVISAAMRSITDVEIEERLRPENSEANKFQNKSLGSGFQAIDSLISQVRGDKELQNKISNELGLTNSDRKDNFFRAFIPMSDGITFGDQLKIGHSGAHNPASLTESRIKDLAKNTILFLELSEGFINVLKGESSSPKR